VSKPLIPAQRRERIQAYLATHRIVATSDLCELLDVSEATVRRDLERLEQEGLVERTHGGAILSQQLNSEQEYQQREQRYPEEKRAIGAAAASLIEDGDIVFINSGTTSTQVIRHIRSDIDATIITNNLIASLEVGEIGYGLILLGGEFQPKSNSVGGRFAIDNLSQIYADKAFMGVDGISPKHGCTVPTSTEAEVIRLMIERTTGPISVVTDHSKWGVVSNYEVAKVSQIHRLITDEGLDESACESIASLSIEILLATTNSQQAQHILGRR
jgi:DeoR family fructose operon transcriptional repressor